MPHLRDFGFVDRLAGLGRDEEVAGAIAL
jgi:hypothetical protein